MSSIIDGVSSNPTTSTATSTAGSGLQGSKDEFLKLFMAQLQHQDPFAPTSGADMVAQLAQLSSVEQARETNTQLADLAAAQASSASAGLSSLVGRNCSANATNFSIDSAGGPPPPLKVEAGSAMTGASVVITDDNGKEIRRIAVPDGSKSATVQWDGKDAAGNPVTGSFHVSVDMKSSSTVATATWAGRVDAVELTADGPRLRMGNVLLAPADIRTIGTITTPSTTIPGVLQ